MSTSLAEEIAASVSPNNKPFSSPRDFHLFPELPTELRLKIWGIRSTDFARIVNIEINEVSLEELVLTLTDDPVLPFRACKEERSEYGMIRPGSRHPRKSENCTGQGLLT